MHLCSSSNLALALKNGFADGRSPGSRLCFPASTVGFPAVRHQRKRPKAAAAVCRLLSGCQPLPPASAWGGSDASSACCRLVQALILIFTPFLRFLITDPRCQGLRRGNTESRLQQRRRRPRSDGPQEAPTGLQEALTGRRKPRRGRRKLRRSMMQQPKAPEPASV